MLQTLIETKKLDFLFQEEEAKKIGQATIYHSDCMEAFKKLPNNSIDFIVNG